MYSRTLGVAAQSSNALAGFRLQSSNNGSRPLASRKLDNQFPQVHSPQLELELAHLSRAPARRVRYLPELDMEIKIVEPPKKVIVNKDLRVQALREHWDEKEINTIHRHSSVPKPFSPLRFELSK